MMTWSSSTTILPLTRCSPSSSTKESSAQRSTDTSITRVLLVLTSATSPRRQTYTSYSHLSSNPRSTLLIAMIAKRWVRTTGERSYRFLASQNTWSCSSTNSITTKKQEQSINHSKTTHEMLISHDSLIRVSGMNVVTKSTHSLASCLLGTGRKTVTPACTQQSCRRELMARGVSIGSSSPTMFPPRSKNLRPWSIPPKSCFTL